MNTKALLIRLSVTQARLVETEMLYFVGSSTSAIYQRAAQQVVDKIRYARAAQVSPKGARKKGTR